MVRTTRQNTQTSPSEVTVIHQSGKKLFAISRYGNGGARGMVMGVLEVW